MTADRSAKATRTLHVLTSASDADRLIEEISANGSETHWVLSESPPPRERLLPTCLEWIHVPSAIAPGAWGAAASTGAPPPESTPRGDTLKELVDAFRPTHVRVHGREESPVADRIRDLIGPGVRIEGSDPITSTRVAYVLKKFPRYSETFILREVLALESIGVRVQIFSLKPPQDGRFHASLARLGHTVEYVPDAGGSKSLERLLPSLPADPRGRETLTRLFWECVDRGRPELLRSLAQAVHIAGRVRDLELDHIHAHFATSASEVARFTSCLSGVGFSFTAHAKDIYSDDVDHDGLARKLADAAFAVTVCDANREYLESRHPASAEKVRRLYNGIDLERHAGSAEEVPVTPMPHILAVGRFVEKKGFELLVDALAELNASGHAFTAEIVGDGERLESIRAKVAELRLDHVVSLPGACSSEQVREKMRRATVLACPCIIAANGDKDALPTVLLESLAEGLPCVATDVAGIPEILDGGHAGLIVAPTATDVARGIRELLDDPARRDALRAAGLERVADVFDLTANARVLASWFAPEPARERTAAVTQGSAVE